MLKQLKIEWFFLRKMWVDRTSFGGYVRYFKNRFFGAWLLNRAPFRQTSGESDFSIHVLCQKKDLWMLYWCLTSFLFFSKTNPEIVIHDDGTIDEKSAGLLERKFSNLKVLRKVDADKLIQNHPGYTEEVRYYRTNGHRIIMEFIDIYLLSKSQKIMVLDSDILFFKRPQEIIDFVNGASSAEALIERQDGTYDLQIKSVYDSRCKITERNAGYMNPGIILYKKESLLLDRFLEYFDNTTRDIKNYFLGMAGWGSLVSQSDFKFLPLESYHIKGPINSRTVVKHFTSPRRHELHAYGIDKIKNIIEKDAK